MSEQSESAMWRIALRNTAPAFRRLLEHYSVQWSEMFFNLYLSFSYQKGKDVQNPENTLMIINSILSNKSEIVPYEKLKDKDSSELSLLLDMFPMFYEHLEKQANTWGVSVFDIFLMMRYKTGATGDTEDSLEVQIRTKPSSGKKLSMIL